MKNISHQGLIYRWTSNSFLSEAQTGYALEQLWRLVAGTADWEGAGALTFEAVDSTSVQTMLDAPAHSMPWIALSEAAPPGWVPRFDTDRLPAVCALASLPTAYTGVDAFPLDLVAATFIQLTRWEEWARPNLDQFGCHKEDASLAARQGFRDRPVLDEWAAVLRAWLKFARPSWREQIVPYHVEISHDIDFLRYYTSPLRVARSVGRRLLLGRQGIASLDALREGALALLDPRRDPCVTAFDTLMRFSESLGGRSTFFFMAARPGKYDDGYDVDTRLFQSLRERILERGHHLGWHPGYCAAEDDSVFIAELERYARAIGSSDFGVRHHFLRWRAGSSWRRLAAHGRPYDASVGYNYCIGFRASTARPYPAFDLDQNQQLPLQVRPLVAMDGPLLRDATPISAQVARIARRCRLVDGCLTLLVHNYSLMNAPTLLPEIAHGLSVAGESQ